MTNAEPEEEEEDDDDEGDGDLSKYNLDDEVLLKEKKEAQPNRATSLCKLKTDVNVWLFTLTCDSFGHFQFMQDENLRWHVTLFGRLLALAFVNLHLVWSSSNLTRNWCIFFSLFGHWGNHTYNVTTFL